MSFEVLRALCYGGSQIVEVADLFNILAINMVLNRVRDVEKQVLCLWDATPQANCSSIAFCAIKLCLRTGPGGLEKTDVICKVHVLNDQLGVSAGLTGVYG